MCNNALLHQKTCWHLYVWLRNDGYAFVLADAIS